MLWKLNINENHFPKNNFAHIQMRLVLSYSPLLLCVPLLVLLLVLLLLLTTLPTTTRYTYYCLAFGSTSRSTCSSNNNRRTSNYYLYDTQQNCAHTYNSAHREMIMGDDNDDENNNEKKNNDSYYKKSSIYSLEQILKFTRTNPNAVVLTLWPSAIGYENESNPTQTQQVDVSKAYLHRSGATLLYESSLEIPETVSTLFVMAMYWGEEWLKTNCWYQEQPLEDLGIPGLTRQSCSVSSWPGAQWKKELCFRQQQQQQQQKSSTTTTGEEKEKTKRMTMHILIADVGNASGSNNNYINHKRGRLWSEKYSVRATMARDTGHAGNSCLHLTDDQSGIVGRVVTGTSRNNYKVSGSGGMECNASYAFACARLLLNPQALEFLVHCATTTTDAVVRVVNNNDDNIVPSSSSSEEFEQVVTHFCQWLGDRNFEDIVTVPDISSLEEKQDMNVNRKKEERNSINTNGTTTTTLGTNKQWKRAPLW